MTWFNTIPLLNSASNSFCSFDANETPIRDGNQSWRSNEHLRWLATHRPASGAIAERISTEQPADHVSKLLRFYTEVMMRPFSLVHLLVGLNQTATPEDIPANWLVRPHETIHIHLAYFLLEWPKHWEIWFLHRNTPFYHHIWSANRFIILHLCKLPKFSGIENVWFDSLLLRSYD